MPDGELTTVDNTRVMMAKHAGIDVSARMHEYGDAIDPLRADELATRGGDVPTTWGQGVENRVGRQNDKWQKRYPMGSHIVGWDGNSLA